VPRGESPPQTASVNFGKVKRFRCIGAVSLTAQAMPAVGGDGCQVGDQPANDERRVERGTDGGDSLFNGLHQHPVSFALAPTDAQVACVLAAISAMPKPVFVHCRYGCDRTGTILACYAFGRIAGPTLGALKEAEVLCISPFEVAMRNYIKHFKK